MRTDRQLLLGLLALQCGFISKEQLVAAFSGWTSDKSRSLEQILCENRAISEQQQALLAALVEEHLKQHEGDPEKSLAAIGSFPPIKAGFEENAVSEIIATLDLMKLGVVKSGESNSEEVEATIDIGPLRPQSGRFIFLRSHAKGGLGQVSVALDSELNRHVALKEILPERADDLNCQGRFVLEAEITGQLEHPGIVPVYGLGTYANGRPYYAMRFVEGENLKRAIERFHKDRRPGEQLTGERAVAFRNLLGRFVDVCNALEYAHSRKVLHRDLKPENILLGPYGETLVVDWGLAKSIGAASSPGESNADARPVQLRSGTSSESINGMVVGTPAYMSPEQAEGKISELGPATDIYSLGATLYALLTGNPPIKGDSVVNTLEKVRLNEIERPRLHWSAIPKPLEAVCLKAMALKPRDRYASAKALSEEIEKWLADEPVSAFAEPLTVRVTRWIKRHPAIVSTSAACVVLGFCAAFFVAYLQGAHAKVLERKNTELMTAKNRAEEQRGRAEEREQEAIAAVKRFGDAVSASKELKNSPALESLRKELLKEPLGFFKSLRSRLQANSDSRPASLAKLAAAAYALGQLTEEIGDKQDAMKAYQESLTIYERLARENPTVLEYQSELGISHNSMGILLAATGKRTEALAAYQRAKAIHEALVQANPAVGEFQSALARSHNNLGNLLRGMSRPAEALAAFEQAKRIHAQLAKENPKVTEYQNFLASSQINIGNLLRDMGNPTDALAAFEQAKVNFERLASENPGAAEYWNHLASSQNNIGNLLSDAGNSTEALEVYEQAKTIQERLVRDHPSVTEYQNYLANSLNNMGNLFRNVGKSNEALTAFEQAKTIQERLVREHPFVNEYQNYLATSYNSIGTALGDVGKSTEALAAYGQARALQERLVRENPSIADYQNRLGGTLNNLATFHLGSKQFAEAGELLREAIQCQKRALDGNPRHPTYRQFLNVHLRNLLEVGVGLDDSMIIQEAERGMAELAQSDPSFEAIDARMAGVLRGEEAKDAEELVSFGRRAYDLRRYAQAARFFGDALKVDPALAKDRERQLPLSAACSAALAGWGRGLDEMVLDDLARKELRGQALGWLQGELDRWEQGLPTMQLEERDSVIQTMKFWQRAPDLKGVRETSTLEKMSEAERMDWLTLWRRVGELQAKAESNETQPIPDAPSAPSAAKNLKNWRQNGATQLLA